MKGKQAVTIASITTLPPELAELKPDFERALDLLGAAAWMQLEAHDMVQAEEYRDRADAIFARIERRVLELRAEAQAVTA